MTCKDCFHYEACSFYNQNLKDEYDPIEWQCDNFKNKSLIYEIPCKEIYERIGDYMYCITDETDEVIEVIVGVIEIDCQGREWIETMVVDYEYETEDEMSKYINFRFADNEKTLFLTREEAEKALRERDNHD